MIKNERNNSEHAAEGKKNDAIPPPASSGLSNGIVIFFSLSSDKTLSSQIRRETRENLPCPGVQSDDEEAKIKMRTTAMSSHSSVLHPALPLCILFSDGIVMKFEE